MAKAKQITIGGLTFKTQKETESYVRHLLLELEQSKEVDSNSEKWPFLFSLIERHPDSIEKKGTGILRFLVGRSVEGHVELNLLRTDNTQVDISWKKCISGKATSELSNLKAAMRVQVQNQIDDFKYSNFLPEGICEICNATLNTPKSVHVDHVVHFDSLVGDFLKDNPDYPKQFDDEPLTNKAKFKIEDLSYAENWSNFHQENASLRLVHGSCNLRRKKAR